MIEYGGKLALAPMVRSGEIPTRLMALRYGADLVWTPEIVDKKLIKCQRVQNDDLGTVDFLDPNKKLVFRTCPEKERGKLIFQIGSADAELAVQAAKVVAQDVDGIDLNCGCPKPFSTHSGMGAALLSTPDLLVLILENLVNQVGKVYNIPISAKIRLLDDADAVPSLALIDRLCKTGISNLTLHCRTPRMRNRDAPIRDFLPAIIETVHSNNVSFIINGSIRNRREFSILQQKYGNKVGGMIAESAESNPTVFAATPLPWNQVVPEFIKIAQEMDNYPGNTKYIMLNQVPGKSKFYQKFCQAKTHKELFEIAETIGEEGNKIMMKYMQKDVLINPSDFESYRYEIQNKRKLEHENKINDNEKIDKKQKTVAVTV
ncbi:unnamed protein product [Debaryomyces fabryi]|nr:unnamed protein product [Debaryomyces fabryi]